MHINQERLVNEKIGKLSQENYFLICELEEMKNKSQQYKNKNEELDKLNEENISKIKKFKEKFKEKETLYFEEVLKKNELEKKLEKIIFKVRLNINQDKKRIISN